MANKFGFDTTFFQSVFNSGRAGAAVSDIYVNYSIPMLGTFNLKVFDVQYLVIGVDYFRPIIQGFIVFWLGVYNIRMILSFIRQDSGVVAGKAVDAELSARSYWSDKLK